MKRRIRLTESDLHKIIKKNIRKALRESFEDDYNAARDNFHSSRPNGMWGMEMKNPDGEWEYGEVKFDPNAMTMSCMGVTIDVDPASSVDANLEGLYEKLCENGYSND